MLRALLQLWKPQGHHQVHIQAQPIILENVISWVWLETYCCITGDDLIGGCAVYLVADTLMQTPPFQPHAVGTPGVSRTHWLQQYSEEEGRGGPSCSPRNATHLTHSRRVSHISSTCTLLSISKSLKTYKRRRDTVKRSSKFSFPNTHFLLPPVILPFYPALLQSSVCWTWDGLTTHPPEKVSSTIMLCKVCREGLEGVWDPSKTKRVCRFDEFVADELPVEDNKFITVETYKTVEVYDPDFRRPEHYMFGHHLSQQSFEQSVRDGCVMCDRFKPWHEGHDGKANPKIIALGYYSLFSVCFQPCPLMSIYINNSSGGFELSRYIGKQRWTLMDVLVILI